MMSLRKRVFAELLGTFWLVFAGCGTAVFSARFPTLGVGFAGIALAFGLSVLTIAYAIGHISGAHLNPAVTAGLVAARKFPKDELLPYIAGQLVGAIIASSVLYLIASGKAGFALSDGFGANGYGLHSPAGFSFTACLLSEFVLTFMFLMIILGSTSIQAPKGFAPLAIGLGLTLIHLISIPITGTSVNPARSTAPALFVGGWALQQLWLFWLAPIAGAISAGALFRMFTHEPALGLVTPERPLKRAESA
jgi:aquaporin Z